MKRPQQTTLPDAHKDLSDSVLDSSFSSPVLTPPLSHTSDASDDGSYNQLPAYEDVEAQITESALEKQKVITRKEKETRLILGVLFLLLGPFALLITLFYLWYFLTALFNLLGIPLPPVDGVVSHGNWSSGFDEGYKQGIEKAMEAVNHLEKVKPIWEIRS